MNDENSLREHSLGAVECAAAEWALRHREGLDAAAKAEFVRWLNSDGRHADIFAEMEKTFRLLDRLPETVPASLRRRHRFGRQAWWIAPLAIAAGAAVAATLLWRHPPARPAPVEQSFATDIGGLRHLDLPDGSVVQLNTDSAVEVRYNADERRVRLIRGEAFFTVAKNPARPFWVVTDTISVRAVGTAFDVRYRPDVMEVLVTEGKVQIVDRAGRSVLSEISKNAAATAPEHGQGLLAAGQKVTVPTPAEAVEPGAIATVSSTDPQGIARALAWRENRLEFFSTPLSEVVAEFNRYNRHKLIIADPSLARVRFGGAFAPRNYDSFVATLEEGFGVAAERREHETILRKAP